MNSFAKVRLEHAICFFAAEFQRRARKPLPSMGLYKLLALMDFNSVKTTGSPVFGLEYLALKMGPVPELLYRNRDQFLSLLFTFNDLGEGRATITANGKPDMTNFSGREVDEMNRWVEIFSDSAMTTALFSEATHQEILAWSRTWRARPNQRIDYKDEFPGDVESKSEADLTPQEESFLFWRAAQRLNAAG